MTDLATIMIERAVDKAVGKALSNYKVDIAKRMLKRGTFVEDVAEDTGLDEAIVREL